MTHLLVSHTLTWKPLQCPTFLPSIQGYPWFLYIGPENAKHGCRLKVSQFYGAKMRVGQWFFMTVEHKPHIIGDTGEIKLKDIKLVQDFIIINIRVILDFWEQDECIDPTDMMGALIRVS